MTQSPSSSGPADRYNADKPRLSLALQCIGGLAGFAAAGEYGMQKYSRNNYQRGLPQTEVADSLLRHLAAYLSGEDIDPESGVHNLDLANWNAMLMAHQKAHPELDDRGFDGFPKPDIPWGAPQHVTGVVDVEELQPLHNRRSTD